MRVTKVICHVTHPFESLNNIAFLQWMFNSKEKAMNESENLKNEGNLRFQQGDSEGAASAYEEGLQLLLSKGELSAPEKALAAILSSNLSQALFTLGDVQRSGDAAKAATELDPSSVKALFRYARALFAQGRYFAAFVTIHHQLKQRMQHMSIKERHDVAGDLFDKVAAAVGVSSLHDTFSLTPCGSGLTVQASSPCDVDTVLFVEAKLSHPRLDSTVRPGKDGLMSSEVLVLHFARQLYQLQREHRDDPSPASDWSAIQRLMEGSWPRRLEEIPPEQRQPAENLISSMFFEGSSSSEECQALVHLSLLCRYNCFHSGFFRTCALVNHSCNPNAAMKYVQRTESVHMVAVRKIAQNDVIAVKYLSDADYLEGVGRRRELLYDSWLFWCDCSRCAGDIKETSLCEWKKCSHCDAYAHLPTPGYTATSKLSVDPLGLMSEKQCANCGGNNKWSAEEIAILQTARQRVVSAQSHGNFDDIWRALVESQSEVSLLVHPEHWIHRVLLYYFCLPVTNFVGKMFHAAQQASSLDDTVPLLRHFGASRDDRNGGDTLHSLRELWRRIEPFYPPNEGWAVHCAICRLVVLSLCLPLHPSSLSPEDASGILAFHGPLVGEQEQSTNWRFLQMHKPSEKSQQAIPPKHMKSVRKAFGR